MKKTLLYFVAFVFTLSLSSCCAVWDMAVLPFVKYDMEESSASTIQTIMFGKNAQCVGGYELCYGNAKSTPSASGEKIHRRK